MYVRYVGWHYRIIITIFRLIVCIRLYYEIETPWKEDFVFRTKNPVDINYLFYSEILESLQTGFALQLEYHEKV